MDLPTNVSIRSIGNNSFASDDGSFRSARRIHPTRRRPKRAATGGFGTVLRSVLPTSSRNGHYDDHRKKSRNPKNKSAIFLNIFCSDIIVSTAFTLGRMKYVRETPIVTQLELEDLIDRRDQSLFLEVQDLITADSRPWDYIKLVDHLYESEERYDRYLALKGELWRLVEDDVRLRKIPLQFQAIMELQRGSRIASVIAFLQRIHDSVDLQSVEFEGALFGYLPARIPTKLQELFNHGCLRETVILKVSYQIPGRLGTHEARSLDEKAGTLALDSSTNDTQLELWETHRSEELGDNSVLMGKARTIKVLASCIGNLSDMKAAICKQRQRTDRETAVAGESFVRKHGNELVESRSGDGVEHMGRRILHRSPSGQENARKDKCRPLQYKQMQHSPASNMNKLKRRSTMPSSIECPSSSDPHSSLECSSIDGAGLRKEKYPTKSEQKVLSEESKAAEMVSNASRCAERKRHILTRSNTLPRQSSLDLPSQDFDVSSQLLASAQRKGVKSDNPPGATQEATQKKTESATVSAHGRKLLSAIDDVSAFREKPLTTSKGLPHPSDQKRSSNSSNFTDGEHAHPKTEPIPRRLRIERTRSMDRSVNRSRLQASKPASCGSHSNSTREHPDTTRMQAVTGASTGRVPSTCREALRGNKLDAALFKKSASSGKSNRTRRKSKSSDEMSAAEISPFQKLINVTASMENKAESGPGESSDDKDSAMDTLLDDLADVATLPMVNPSTANAQSALENQMLYSSISMLDIFGADTSGKDEHVQGVGEGPSESSLATYTKFALSSSELTVDYWTDSSSEAPLSGHLSAMNLAKARGKKAKSRHASCHKSMSDLQPSTKSSSKKKKKTRKVTTSAPSTVMTGPLAPHRFCSSMVTSMEYGDDDDSKGLESTVDHAFKDQEPDFQWQTNGLLYR
jgi:hypothetical protein